MSMGSLGGIISSAAGSSLSQTTGSETERTRKEALTQSREVDAKQKAEGAAGIGQTQEDEETSERDADGRRLWERPDQPADGTPDVPNGEAATRQSKDASGLSGTKLDLTG